MASSTTADHPAKKAGYWFSTFELQVADIKSDHFTHLYAGFAKVQYQKNDDVIKFPDNSGRFESFSETVKGTNPRVKTLLSIGGDEGPNISSAIASVARDAKLREAFINRSIQLAREHKYDGLDLCWLYPSNAEQMDLLAKLLKEWRQAVNKEKAEQTDSNYGKLLLTAAVFHHPAIPDTDGNNVDYPCQAISKYLDWINVLTIESDTPSPCNSPGKTGPVHAWLGRGKEGIEDWIERDVPTENLILGLPFHVYNLVNDHDHDDIATKVKEAFRGKKLGGYFAWHQASNDDKQTLLNAASNAVRSAGNVTAGHQQNSHHDDFGIRAGDGSTIGTVYNAATIGSVDKIGGDKISGDKIGGDKIGKISGDKISGDKISGDKIGKIGGDKIGGNSTVNYNRSA